MIILVHSLIKYSKRHGKLVKSEGKRVCFFLTRLVHEFTTNRRKEFHVEIIQNSVVRWSSDVSRNVVIKRFHPCVVPGDFRITVFRSL